MLGAVGAQAADSGTLSDLRRLPFGRADVVSFAAPPRSFFPETWFHFIGGNVATQGITADLEAIAAAGIAGVQLFHGQFGGPWPGVEPQIRCLSESWDGAVRHVAEECRRLGLRFTMQNCPGWATAGGPWITPDKAMRHLVWSRTDVSGGTKLEMNLPRPQPSREAWRDYQDVAVLAFPTPEGDTEQRLIPASIRSNREELPWDKCLRKQKDGTLVLEPGSEPVWVEVTFEDTVTLRTVEFPGGQSLNHHWSYVPGVTVTVQAVLPEGMREVARYDLPQSNWQDNRPISLACSEMPARTYRITINHQHTLTLASLQLFSGARKHNWEGAAGWVLRGLDRGAHPDQARATWVEQERIVVLTDHLDAQGTLRWTAPPGRWTILRWGNVNTGKRNSPAPPEATGWECDKLSPIGAETHFAGYIGRLASAEGALGGGLLHGMLLDSWECETQTWTPKLDEEFSRLHGYALRPWMPALAGFVIADPETTARFLRDWRVTLNRLLVDNFFGRMAALGHRQGLTVMFETAAGDVFPGDILEYYKHADVPMCEFWQPRTEGFVGSFNFKPVKPCVSAARMYGKPRVAAEAFTSFDLTWNEHPGWLKPVADLHLAEGITHMVFHTYTHNPRTDFLPPGTAFGSSIGTPFLRQQTWWRHMPEFTAYLARCSYLLERGRPVSDVLWYLGDEQDHKPLEDAPFPPGYRHDYCNPDVLLNRLTVRRGRWVTPEGLEYRLLWIPDGRRMVPETLERLVALVRQGAVLVGEPPAGLATRGGGVRAGQRFQDAVRVLWGPDRSSMRGSSTNPVRKVGKGRVLSGLSLSEALAKLDIKPDVQGGGVRWNHRQVEGADWYFVAAAEGFQGELQFRSVGRVELWDPRIGSITPVRQAQRRGNLTRVTLDLPPSGSVFVVFNRGNVNARAAKPTPDAATRECDVQQTLALDGPWDVAFPPGWGAPTSIRVDALKSWTDLDLSPEGRAFSGTATYTTEFHLDALTLGTRVELDLGRVEVIGSVQVNSEPAGTVWSPPYRLEITRLVKPGRNRLEVDVTSTWFNRLVYDAGLEETARKTWTISGPSKDKAPVPSGLVGPVTLRLSGKERLPGIISGSGGLKWSGSDGS